MGSKPTIEPQSGNPSVTALPKEPAISLIDSSARYWRAAAWMCGAFTIAVGLIMLFSHLAARDEDPLNSSQLKDLKEQLRKAPTDEQLKNSIRALDLELRERHFRHLSRMNSGVWLLLIGTGFFILSSGRVMAAAKKPVLPCLRKPGPSASLKTAEFSRFSVAAVGAITGAGLLWITTSAPRSVLPNISDTANIADGTAIQSDSAPDYASPAELAREWPAFRGHEGSGLALAANPPVRWDADTGEGIAWKVESPSTGFNSPLVFGGNIYLSGGDASKLEVVALRVADGQIAWRQALGKIPGSSSDNAEIPESTGYAPATMATDGRRVYAIFANGSLGAFTMDGQPAWAKSFGALKNVYGHATSLATWRDRLIVQLDQGETEDGKSMLYALDGRTGKPVWQRPRKVGASWASPIVFDADGKSQVVALSLPWAIAYSAVDGSELWRVDCLNGEVTPSPVFAGGLLLVASPSDRIVSIRPDGTGDVTKTHMVWSFDEDIPDVTSPVSNGELVFMVTTYGMLTCLDITNGTKLWDHELEMECHASPVIAGGKLYQFGQDGSVVVIEAGREYKEVFRTKMPDSFHATPAIVGDHIVLRGMTNIWCIGPGGKVPAN
jgi:outer membrane protein assembly factor BamB